jgi:tRNA 2-selenouridine synthase
VSLVAVDAAQVAAMPGRFDAIIDARSPAEFAEDHLPGAVNWPVLDDEQRRTVGSLYKQVSALQARKLGAALVARNIADHVERHLRDIPREWQPLVYCWRGGQRSASLAWFLGQIGFRSAQLSGGYKAWRALVRDQLLSLPRQFNFRVLCGRTGSGKTRLLHALAATGAQVLDLEGLAEHRGSVLGALPGRAQPSQKHFDSRVWLALRGFDPARDVFVESESRKIGALRVPEALITTMRDRGRCIEIVLDEAARLRLLLEDYAHFADDAPGFARLLDGLAVLRGRDTVRAWQALALQGQWPVLFTQLMQQHYDPMYLRSLRSSYAQLAQAERLGLANADAATLRQAAQRLLG